MTESERWDAVRIRASRIAREEQTDMVIGWQQNDDTGEDEPGFCPAAVVGPCFVHTVTERFPAVRS